MIAINSAKPNQAALSFDNPSVHALDVAAEGVKEICVGRRMNRVLYCSTSCKTREDGRSARQQAKAELVPLLLGRMHPKFAASRFGGPDCARCSSSIALSHGSLGRPVLYVDGRKGPSVSFSHVHGIVWAAMGLGSVGVGIDAAHGNEFQHSYPFDRAFHRDELLLCIGRCRNNRQEAAAMLWSVKEAAAKALGCGFHLLDPLDLRVDPSSEADSTSAVLVRVGQTAADKAPCLTCTHVAVRIFRDSDYWVSVAVADL